MACPCMASIGTGSLALFDVVTKDRSSQLNSVYRVRLCAQIQANAATLIGFHFTVPDGDPKHTVRATQQFLGLGLVEYCEWLSQSPGLNPVKLNFTCSRQKDPPTSTN